MPTDKEIQKDIHKELVGFEPEIIDVLDSADFFDTEGPYNPTEIITSIPKQALNEFKKESTEKNSRVWDIVKGLIIGQAIGAGIDAFRQSYPRKVDKQPSAQDYMDRYIKEHGGEFIRGMSQSDQKKLVNFIWSNAGKNERPLAKEMKNQPWICNLIDNGNHRSATIIRTEKHRATSYGTSRSAKDSGAEFHIRHEAGDKRTRPSHMAMIGERKPIDEPYSNGEMYPGETSINCRGHESFEW